MASFELLLGQMKLELRDVCEFNSMLLSIELGVELIFHLIAFAIVKSNL